MEKISDKLALIRQQAALRLPDQLSIFREEYTMDPDWDLPMRGIYKNGVLIIQAPVATPWPQERRYIEEEYAPFLLREDALI